MPEEEYKHWRENMDMPYLRAETLQPDEKRILTIKKVVRETMPKIPGRTSDVEEHQNVCYFEEDSLPMVLNVTNCETLTALFGTGNINKWAGKKMAIYASKTTLGKKTVPCLRVCKFRPDICSVCGKEITEPAIYKSSIARFGKPICSKECYETGLKGPDAL